MPFDAHKNLAITSVATAPSPATSGTTLTVASGEGARFPAAPFNATVWPVSQPPTPVNAEIVRVTAIAGDTLTITRAQEGTTARSIIAGDLIAETITAKALTDIESGVNFPQLVSAGDVSAVGSLRFNAVGGANTLHQVGPVTNDGADYQGVEVQGGGGTGPGRGAYVGVYGNEYTAPGYLDLTAGNVVGGGHIRFNTSATIRGQMHRSGGFSWGGTTDPGVGAILLGSAGFAAGETFVRFFGGQMNLGSAGTAAANACYFYNANGPVGYIQTSGTTTAFLTSSDARLKTDRGRHTDPEVLRRTVIHNFIWTADGTPGRGVFAQEAAAVAPFAVTVGTDDRDDAGRLKNPWGVDYSKYVPDLIAGWQGHDEKIQFLARELMALTVTVRVTARPTLMARMATAIRASLAALFPAWITP